MNKHKMSDAEWEFLVDTFVGLQQNFSEFIIVSNRYNSRVIDIEFQLHELINNCRHMDSERCLCSFGLFKKSSPSNCDGIQLKLHSMLTRLYHNTLNIFRDMDFKEAKDKISKGLTFGKIYPLFLSIDMENNIDCHPSNTQRCHCQKCKSLNVQVDGDMFGVSWKCLDCNNSGGDY